MQIARRPPVPLLGLFLTAATCSAGVITVSSGDGIDLSLDDATGAIVGFELSPWSVFERSVFGGLYVRDRAAMLDVPPATVNLLPNASFELDDGDGIPDGWIFNPGSGATLTLEPDPYDGTQSAVIHDRSGGRLESRVVVCATFGCAPASHSTPASPRPARSTT